jgi:hypothetical protein
MSSGSSDPTFENIPQQLRKPSSSTTTTVKTNMPSPFAISSYAPESDHRCDYDAGMPGEDLYGRALYAAQSTKPLYTPLSPRGPTRVALPRISTDFSKYTPTDPLEPQYDTLAELSAVSSSLFGDETAAGPLTVRNPDSALSPSNECSSSSSVEEQSAELADILDTYLEEISGDMYRGDMSSELIEFLKRPLVTPLSGTREMMIADDDDDSHYGDEEEISTGMDK